MFGIRGRILLAENKILGFIIMSCGTYCYHNQWACRPGRLRKLSEVQIQPGPTRNYGSEGARVNSIRRRVLRVNRKYNNGDIQGNRKQTEGYGPLFGTAEKPSIFNNCTGCGGVDNGSTKFYYRQNGGTGSDVSYWKRVMGGSTNLFPTSNVNSASCSLDERCTGVENVAGAKVSSNFCSLGGNRWLNFRRGL